MLTELTKEQKIQIINNRRVNVSRNVFELELDIIVLQSATTVNQESIDILNARITELEATDLALQEFANSLNA